MRTMEHALPHGPPRTFLPTPGEYANQTNDQMHHCPTEHKVNRRRIGTIETKGEFTMREAEMIEMIEGFANWNKTEGTVMDAAGELEGTVSNLGDAVAMMNELIDPIVNPANKDDYYISVTKGQAKALYGLFTHMANIHTELDEEVKDLYHAIKTSRKDPKPLDDENYVEEINRLNLLLEEAIQDLNKAAFAARKKTTDESLEYTRMITDKSIEEINRLNLELEKNIEDLNRMNLKLEEAGIPID